MWIISHPHIIQSTIENHYITVKFDNLNMVVNIELRHKVLFKVSVRELQIDILKNIILIFPWHTIQNYWSVLVIMIFN